MAHPVAADARPPGAQPRFLALYALAYAGGVTAYVPLLVLLLPLKVEAVADASRVGLLTVLAIAGAVAASVGNIVFGAWSDRAWLARGSRRRWIMGGLLLTAASYGGIAAAATPVALVAAVVAFQLVLNMMLAPLSATMADAVPDTAKGVAGGLLSIAQPVGSLVGAGVTGWLVLGEGARLAAVIACVAAMVLPLLLAGRPPADGAAAVAGRAMRRVDLAFLWASRMCVQIANVVLFTYLLFFFEEVAGRDDPLALASRLGHLTAGVYLLSVPVALVMGRASDRIGVRKPFLVGAALAGAAGLTLMAISGGCATAVAGYALFASASAAFLALQSSYAMQVLPSPRTRGRDLGLLNLANTLPSLLGPALTWGLVADARFGSVLAALALLTLAGGMLVLPVKSGG